MLYKRNSVWLMLGVALVTIFVVAGVMASGSASAQTPNAEEGVSMTVGMNTGLNQDDDPPPPSPVTVDHSEFPILNQDFTDPTDLTRACLNCHVDAADQIQHTTHWTWEFVNETTGQTLGKKNLINNFCVATASNEPRCTSCHVGYGWTDDTFDFTASENVDCVVCHDTTGTYKKVPTGAGAPDPAVDLAVVAQNVGLTSRETCGACHFYGGGGDEVKHGDLDSSLISPDRELDVHMAVDGLDFSCTTCHVTDDHNIPGSRYSMDPEEWMGCEECHTSDPHELDVLNTHASKVACQTCHIPEFARGDIPTKMTWDWSTAGKFTDDGQKIATEDYNTLKGDFTWEENVVPEYVWFNGTVEYSLLGDTIDPSQAVDINKFTGDKNDPSARIWPVKRFVGNQPYDSVNNTLVVPHLFGKDDTAYWANFDWNKAIAAGMEYVGQDYSGQYDFVETVMYWPITHMVAPANQAVRCQECHTDEGGRLDFAALGYETSDIYRLTNFPPTMTSAVQETEVYTAANCVNCHEDEYTMWVGSEHGKVGTGCVACHHLEGPGEHPVVTYSIDHSGELCGTCHLDQYEDWKTSVHGEKIIACASCHQPHSQGMRIAPEKNSVCENCHLLESKDVSHSTHTLAGVFCSDCHVNTTEGTGHTFKVGTGTCVECHGQTIHASANIAELTDGNVGIYDPAATDSAEEDAVEEEPVHAETAGIMEAEAPISNAGVNFPVWMIVGVGVFIGVGGYWLLAGQEPGSQHTENTSEETNDEA